MLVESMAAKHMTKEYHLDKELKITLEELESVELENEELKENIREANECVIKLREQIQKFKLRHKEVSIQLKQANETIEDLRLQIEEKKKVEECFKDIIKKKIEDCEKLEQEVKKMKVEAKVLESNKLLDNFISMQKSD